MRLQFGEADGNVIAGRLEQAPEDGSLEKAVVFMQFGVGSLPGRCLDCKQLATGPFMFMVMMQQTQRQTHQGLLA